MRLKRKYRLLGITDIDHNALVELMSEFKIYDSYKKRLRIYSGDASALSVLLNRYYKSYFSKLEVAHETGNKPFVRVFATTQSNRDALLSKLREIKYQGKIVNYNEGGGTTQDGSKIKLSATPGKDTPKSPENQDDDYSGGISTTTIIIIVAAALLLFFIFKKKK